MRWKWKGRGYCESGWVRSRFDYPCALRRPDRDDPFVELNRFALEFAAHCGAHRCGICFTCPRKHGGTCTGDGAAQRACRHGRAPDLLETGNQRLALWLNDHVLERRLDHVEVVRITTGNETGEVGGLPDEIGQVHRALQY